MTPRTSSILIALLSLAAYRVRADTVVTGPGPLVSNCIYVGDGRTLAGSGSISIPAGTKNVFVRGVKLNGINIVIGKGCDGVTIDGCSILNITTGSKAGIVLADGSSDNVTITNNRIDNCPFRGFWGDWNLGNNFTFTDNTLTSCGEGAQGTWARPAKNGNISFNDVSGHTRHGLEFQYQFRNVGLENVLIEGNHIHDWRYYGGDASSIGISGAIGGYLLNGKPAYAEGVVVRRNFIEGSPDFAKAIGKRNTTNETIDANWFVGVEAMGGGTQVYENVICGYRHGVEVANIDAGVITKNVCGGDVTQAGPFVGAPWFRENGNGFDWATLADTSGNLAVDYAAAVPTFPYGPRAQTTSAVAGATAISPPTITVAADGSLLSFADLKAGDTISIRGDDGKWHVIGTASGTVFTWLVPIEYDNWLVWAKRSNATGESSEVKITGQLHYVAPDDLASLNVKLTAALVDVAQARKQLASGETTIVVLNEKLATLQSAYDAATAKLAAVREAAK